MTCLEGDCPSFATRDRRREQAAAGRRTGPSEPTDPAVGLADTARRSVPADEFTVRLSGIGGTGVVTVSQILGTAAMLDGRTVRGLDQTGLSQKAGPVVSDLRISTDATRRCPTTPTPPGSTASSPSTCSSPPATRTAPAPAGTARS